MNQGAAVFSARLMYSRKSGWSAKPQGTGAHLASGNQGIIVCTVLIWDWTKPTIGTEIKGPIHGEGTKTKEKLQNKVTDSEETA